MNKKKLSVVMAGAMLASSVAPVLAATESKVDQNELGSLVLTLKAKLTEKRFSDVAENGGEAGKSVYGIKIKGEKNINTDIDNLTKVGSEEALRLELQDALKGLTAGDTVEIYSKGFKEEDGKVLANETVSVGKYTADEINNDSTNGDKLKFEIIQGLTNGAAANGTAGSYTNLIADNTKVTVGSDKIEITLQNDVEITALPANVTFASHKLTINSGAEKIDFSKATLKTGEIVELTSTPAAADVKGFPAKTNSQPIGEKLIETITITGVENNFKTEELYDGLMLTTAGHDLLATLKEADRRGYTVKMVGLDGTVIPANATNIELKENKGEYGVVITVNNHNKTTKYTVKGAKKATEVLANWLSTRTAAVDILAGDNRYETAVEIAKEQANIQKFAAGNTTNDIVLVNGEALVDGLAAAPLAAQLQKKSTRNVPMLLTEADSLPKATKAYIKELLYNKSQNDLESSDKYVTVHLVGGKTVLSKALENELKEMGLKIERYNGDNREETSLKVAEAIEESKTSSIDKRFIVGADGEADAMSIAPVASDSTTDVTPIIVSKRGGISEDALSTLDGKKVTVIGGEKVVSAEDFEAIEDAVDTKTNAAAYVDRIAGANRKATNAAIIKEYYSASGINGVKSVIVAKDDVLVDALTAANLAVQAKAPIVLAKSSLSKEQNEVLNLYGKSSKTLYQVGHGVDTDNVVAKVAEVLGLLNK